MASRPYEPGLGSMVWPHDAATFVRDYWQKSPLYIEGSRERLTYLKKQFFDFDLDAILGAAHLGDSTVQPPLTRQRNPQGRKLPPPAADVKTFRLLYELGNQLYINTSDVPGVQDWVDRMAEDLGRIHTEGRGDIYATRGGGGAAIHFDQNDNFTIQLQGQKTWLYDTEPFYDQPLHNSGDGDGVAYDAGFSFDAKKIDTDRLQTVVLRPGDFFYIPRGFLHGTEATEDSLSFNINLNASPWVDVLLQGLRNQLTRDRRWRMSATHEPAEADHLIATLKRMVTRLDGLDLVAAPNEGLYLPEGDPVLRRNAFAWWTYRPLGEDDVALEIRTPDHSATVLEVSMAFLDIAKNVPDDTVEIPLTRLLADWPHDVAAGRSFVLALVQGGLLSVVTKRD